MTLKRLVLCGVSLVFAASFILLHSSALVAVAATIATVLAKTCTWPGSTTANKSRYGWNVVPPEITDLDLALNALNLPNKLYLPLILK
jgi:hypothetical protein